MPVINKKKASVYDMMEQIRAAMRKCLDQNIGQRNQKPVYIVMGRGVGISIMLGNISNYDPKYFKIVVEEREKDIYIKLVSK